MERGRELRLWPISHRSQAVLPTGTKPKDNMGNAMETKSLLSDVFRVAMGHHMGIFSPSWLPSFSA